MEVQRTEDGEETEEEGKEAQEAKATKPQTPADEAPPRSCYEHTCTMSMSTRAHCTWHTTLAVHLASARACILYNGRCRS